MRNLTKEVHLYLITVKFIIRQSYYLNTYNKLYVITYIVFCLSTPTMKQPHHTNIIYHKSGNIDDL